MSALPRWTHRVYARLLGYFWLPCPQCGRMFGGHEANPDYFINDGLSSRCVCPACVRAGRYHTPIRPLREDGDQ